MEVFTKLSIGKLITLLKITANNCHMDIDKPSLDKLLVTPR